MLIAPRQWELHRPPRVDDLEPRCARLEEPPVTAKSAYLVKHIAIADSSRTRITFPNMAKPVAMSWHHVFVIPVA